MKRGWWLVGGVAVVIIVAVFFLVLYPHAAAMPNGVACTTEAKICPDGSAVGRTGPSCEFSACPLPVFTWVFTEKGTDALSGAPKTDVSLTLGSKIYSAGIYEGSCSDIVKSSWTLLPGERAGAICWWAGGGVELGVFEEHGVFVLKKGSLDEGDAETAGTRGNFEMLLNLQR